ASIVLDHPGVRPEHCQLHVTGQGVMLSASAGTEVSVNGRRVEGVMALRPGDTVAFHEVRAKLVELDANAAARRTVLDDCARSAANDDPGATAVRAVLPRFMLRGVEGSVAGRTFPLLGPVVVGRSEECGLRMDEEGLS
ncbi:FHA domain-containing protein, partial [Lysobacter sp. D1-1-M9]|uniref:FHA domain-containing protein n=1 Tax=Novilysobacter longmucuonensis TaxID=3098603 RepID=UPI002FCBC586